MGFPHAPAVRIALPERDAQAVLLVEAIEDADAEGALLPLDERAAAARLALEGAAHAPRPSDDALASVVARRARRLLEPDARRGWRAALRATRVGAGLPFLLAALAFLIGLATNVL